MSELGKRILESQSLKHLKENRLSESEPGYRYTDFVRRMKDNATFKELDKLCSAHGYQVHHAIAEKRKNGTINLDIRINAPRGTYHSDIYYDVKWGESKGEFTAQTTSYGALNVEEYGKFLKGCQDTYEVIKTLNQMDLTTLYDPSVDYPDSDEE